MNQYPHFNSKNDLTDGGNVFLQEEFANNLPPEYVQHEYEALQERFAISLYDAIQRCRHPVVVEILENEIKNSDPVPHRDWMKRDLRTKKVRFVARLTPVERRHVVVNVPDYVPYQIKFSEASLPLKSHLLLDKILDFFHING